MGRAGHIRRELGAGAAVVAVLAALLLAPAADAATITVSSTADSGSVYCTLRDAIDAANSDSAKGGCTAGHGADTIRSTVQGPVQLQSALPIIASPMTLALPGPSKFEVLRDAAADFRVFDVRTPDAVTISGVKIANGRLDEYFSEGAGVNHTEGDLTLQNVDVDGNVVTDTESTKNSHALGAGVFNASDATLTIADSTIENNTAMAHATGTEQALADGGLFNSGTLTVRRSTFDSNAATATGEDYGAAGGGGIENSAIAQIAWSTISNNTVTASATNPLAPNGNALTYGAGVYEQDSFSAPILELGLGADTVALNTASATGSNHGQGINRGAGVAVFNGDSGIAQSTIADNSGTSGDATFGDNFDLNAPDQDNMFRDTIVAGGSLAAGNCTRENGTLFSQGDNLEDDSTPASECNFITSKDISNQDPDLLALGDNGGPTMTMALAPGSPAIDAGDAELADTVFLPIDQRGYTRPRDLAAVPNHNSSDGSDIGAFEVQTNITTPAALDFGAVAAGKSSNVKQVTYKNSTASTVQVTTFGPGGVDGGDFKKTSDSCSGQQLAPGATCMVGVKFAPSTKPPGGPYAPGPRYGIVRLSDPSASGWEVRLTGTTFDRTAPKVKIASVSVNGKKRRATAKFSATDNISPKSELSFKCSLDGKKPRRCSSPKTYRKLKPGEHTFAVTARDSAGNTSKAAKEKFKIPRS